MSAELIVFLILGVFFSIFMQFLIIAVAVRSGTIWAIQWAEKRATNPGPQPQQKAQYPDGAPAQPSGQGPFFPQHPPQSAPPQPPRTWQ